MRFLGLRYEFEKARQKTRKSRLDSKASFNISLFAVVSSCRKESVQKTKLMKCSFKTFSLTLIPKWAESNMLGLGPEALESSLAPWHASAENGILARHFGF